MKFSFVAIALAMIVAVNAQEESEPQMHRRLVQVQVNTPHNSNDTTTGGLRGAAASRPNTSLLDELNKMPVPQPVKTKKTD